MEGWFISSTPRQLSRVAYRPVTPHSVTGHNTIHRRLCFQIAHTFPPHFFVFPFVADFARLHCRMDCTRTTPTRTWRGASLGVAGSAKPSTDRGKGKRVVGTAELRSPSPGRGRHRHHRRKGGARIRRRLLPGFRRKRLRRPR